MSAPSIEAHHEQWSDLPLLQWPAVMDDSDVQHWGDILYMRSLAEAIRKLCTPTAVRMLTCPSPIEFDIDVYLEPWPADHAAQMLAAWKQVAA